MIANAWNVSDVSEMPVGTVVLDSRRVAWQRTFTNSWRSTMDHELFSSELVRRYGPVRVLHRPDPLVDEDGRWRCPTCRTNHVMRAHAETCCEDVSPGLRSRPDGETPDA